jgi:hypothetical protein
MKKHLLTFTLTAVLAGCGSVYAPSMLTCHPVVLLTVDNGTPPIKIALYQFTQPQAVGYLLQQINHNTYQSNWVTRSVPNYFITFGEGSWQNIPNPTSLSLTQPREELRQKRSHSGEIALIKNPNGTYGPQLLLRTGTALQGADYLPSALPVGRIIGSTNQLSSFTKGDRLTLSPHSSTCPTTP